MYRDCKLYKSKKTLEPEISQKLWEVSAKYTNTEEPFDINEKKRI